MRVPLVAVAFALALPLLSGCISSTERHSRDDTVCFQDDCTDAQRSYECDGDDCEVCVEGECADCERDECEACFEGGACPMLESQPTSTAPLDDVRIEETHDLSQGMPETTWTFDVAAGATGQLRFTVRDLATREAVVAGGVCMSYEVAGPSEQSRGSRGSCGNVGPMPLTGGTTSGEPQVVYERAPDAEGRYSFKVSASPQPNELVVELVVDNPPLQA